MVNRSIYQSPIGVVFITTSLCLKSSFYQFLTALLISDLIRELLIEQFRASVDKGKDCKRKNLFYFWKHLRIIEICHCFERHLTALVIE